MKYKIDLPTRCWDCKFFDDSGDYPTCLISGYSSGYNFNGRTNKMVHCPLPIDFSYDNLHTFLSYFEKET